MLLRHAVRAAHRDAWLERGGPVEGRRWPSTLIGHYVAGWFE